MSDPVFDRPREIETAAPPAAERVGALALLGRRDFRRVYLAVAASELGDALHYIALMWFALEAGGPLGVIAVRLADSVPALVFGLHGGVAADRFDRKRLMVSADLARAATLVPVAVAGLTGHLPIWALVIAAFILETATSYFAPAYGALVPSLVDRENVQQANALVQATAQALSVGGWALAAALVWALPVSAFFAVNAVSFLASALLISRVRGGSGRAGHAEAPRVREGLAALQPRPMLAAGVVALGAAITISAGTWIGGVPTLVRDTLGHGAGGFAVVMIGYALGSIASGIVLAHVRIRRKALASLLAWTLYLPAYGLMALAGSLGVAIAGAACAAVGQSSAVVLLTSAAQEEVPDSVLGRVLGLISLTHRGAHATGLLFVSTLFAFFSPPTVFAGAAVALPLVGLAGAAFAVSRRGGEARARATRRTRRS
ncbi:MAG TPA: MFS transporter [Gaiellaceae bacterium]